MILVWVALYRGKEWWVLGTTGEQSRWGDEAVREEFTGNLDAGRMLLLMAG